MAVGTLDKETVSLIPDQLKMKQKVDMPIFKITRWNLVKFEEDRLQLRMTMKRKITSEMMTTFFPSFLLTAITFATTFFKPFFFEAALSVNLTTMLVMTTIFMSKMESLPPTSDIKMIDIWLVFCQMVPFVEVVLLTAMEYNRDDVMETAEKSRETQPHIVLEINEEDEDNIDTTRVRWKGFRNMLSQWKAPSLKTVGKGRLLKKKGSSHHIFIVFLFQKRRCYLWLS